MNTVKRNKKRLKTPKIQITAAKSRLQTVKEDDCVKDDQTDDLGNDNAGDAFGGKRSRFKAKKK